MKHKFTLILPLVLFFIGSLALNMGGGIASAASRPHPVNAQGQLLGQAAKSVSYSGASLSKAVGIKHNISRMNCNGSDYFEILTDYDADVDCFAYAGKMPVQLYEADEVYSGNNTGELSYIFNGVPGTAYFPQKDTDYCIHITNNHYGYCDFVYVYSITIY